MLSKRIPVFILLTAFLAVLCVGKELCDFADEACVTNAERKLFKLRISGNKAWGMENSEVLHEEIINVTLWHELKYTFTDVYMYGIKDCNVQKLKFNSDLSWYYYTICPRLTVKAAYVEKGVVDTVPIESQGKAVITYGDYHIGTKGNVEAVTGSDGKPHMNITNYEIDLMESKDKVTYEFTNSFSTDKEKSEEVHKFLNDNWKKVSGEIEYPVLKPFIHQFFSNINNKFLTAVPKNEMFYKDA